MHHMLRTGIKGGICNFTFIFIELIMTGAVLKKKKHRDACIESLYKSFETISFGQTKQKQNSILCNSACHV